MKNLNMVKAYFKGSSGIINPVDSEENVISEGDVLTFEWFNRDRPLPDSLLNKPKEEREEYINRPVFLVKQHKNGGLFAESISADNYLYLHDFRFKHTKIVKHATCDQ